MARGFNYFVDGNYDKLEHNDSEHDKLHIYERQKIIYRKRLMINSLVISLKIFPRHFVMNCKHKNHTIIATQWRSHPYNLLPLCKFQFIFIISFL